MIFANPPPTPSRFRAAIRAATCADETGCVEALLRRAELPATARQRIERMARDIVEGVRRRIEAAALGEGGLDAFLREYGLSSPEGVVLMCLAEALLRIPDAETAERLIHDKIGGADFEKHLGHSDSLLVNASTFALMLTGRFVGLQDIREQGVGPALKRLAAKSGEPVVRRAVLAAMRILGRQFVMGRDMPEALARVREGGAGRWRHSFDMLGEAACTTADAERYMRAYEGALAALAKRPKAGAGRDASVWDAPGLSVKLSALHPRFEVAQAGRAVPETAERLRALAKQAEAGGLNLTVDAEEADRLELQLDVVERVAEDPGLSGWNGLGLAVQAYLKRGPAVLEWLEDVAGRTGRRLGVRLVKGAYWDTEIKRAQERGLDGYPVFTRKANTDVSYLACARRLLEAPASFYPQFATHNAHTVAAVIEMAGGGRDFEFQRLHGMGEALYEEVAEGAGKGVPCRVYAPVGSHEELLPYLMRRLLENGANTSVVNRISDPDADVAELTDDPVAKVRAFGAKPHPRIPLPRDLYGAERVNARGLDLSDPATLGALARAMDEADKEPRRAAPYAGPKPPRPAGRPRAVVSPADRSRVVGEVEEAGPAEMEAALAAAHGAAPDWDQVPAEERARCLERAADLLEENLPALMTVIVREGGRTVPDALSEVREAVDFCRYFALRARKDFGAPAELRGPTGERNALRLHGRGVFACISPWNFPLAIFTGQVTAALAAGNAVIAKPAEQTPLVAAEMVRILHQAGVPQAVLHLLPGPGEEVGARLVGDPRVAGVALTGSTETARVINAHLAARPGPIVPLIAETGGQNAMIVDSSALPEQVVHDVLASAFDSAGQRCSALRMLFVQENVADKLLDMLCGAMAELVVGDPALLSTDIGPVIDERAREALAAHAARMAGQGRLLHAVPLPPEAERGTFFAPHAFEIDRLDLLTREVFGPILHVIRFEAARLDDVIDSVNATGYGLTLGIHSRIEATIERIRRRARVGNIYVNRNMIGAVVGVQPFGGEGLSGTGPKTGGPHYLPRFAVERTVSVNTAATGGNPELLSLSEDEGG
jgi:RHH-type proline utilization regulon transcriptional repressor/proline dehydrogenase/delta 1-pyrroline-5-carboxylate dehydrogenase